MIRRVIQEIASLAAALLILAPSAARLSSLEKEPAITVRIAAGVQDGPVQVIGLKRPQEPSRYALVHLRNGSSVAAKQIWIEAIITGKDGKTASVNPNVFPRRRGHHAISSHEDGWIQEPTLQSSSLVLYAKQLRSNCLRVIVLVMKVEFVDGSSWDNDQGQGSAHPEGADSGPPCQGSTATEPEVDQLMRAEYSKTPTAETLDDSSEVRAYVFSCPLVANGSGLVAVCPF